MKILNGFFVLSGIFFNFSLLASEQIESEQKESYMTEVALDPENPVSPHLSSNNSDDDSLGISHYLSSGTVTKKEKNKCGCRPLSDKNASLIKAAINWGSLGFMTGFVCCFVIFETKVEQICNNTM